MPSNKWHTRINKKVMRIFGDIDNSKLTEEQIKELNAIIDGPSRDFAGQHRQFYHDDVSLLIPVILSKLNRFTSEQKVIIARNLVKMGTRLTLEDQQNKLIRELMLLAIVAGMTFDEDFRRRYLMAQLHKKTDSFFDTVFK